MPKKPGRGVGRPRKAHRHDVVLLAEWRQVHPKSEWQLRQDDGRFQYHPISGQPMVRVASYAVVLDWRKHNDGSTYYRVVRITTPLNGQIYGRPAWVRSYFITPTSNPRRNDGGPFKYKRAWSTVRANEAMGNSERGCSSQCCIHVAMRPSDVLQDGTFAWDNEDDPDE